MIRFGPPHSSLGTSFLVREIGMVPQYGFLGSYADADISKPESKLFLNTNAPFSAFICGVQGSGKSHTTSCILGKSLLSRSRNHHS